MALNVAIIYNDPQPDRYLDMGESKAELGVMDEVKAVHQALDELGYSALLVPLNPPLDQVKKHLESLKVDVIFNLFEGFGGYPETESQVAAMLQVLNFKFTGCPYPALELALDKARTKILLSAAGILTPQYQIITPDNIATFDLDFPCIVKPVSDDASHGISEDSLVIDNVSLRRQVSKVSRLFGGKALVEEFLEGREFNTTVMGNGRLTIPAISEIVYTLPPDKPRILTFEAKWEENSFYFANTQAVCPADINELEQQAIGKIARAAFRLTGCRGYARVDLRQDRTGQFKVLEVNPNPDITPGSGAARQIAAAGMTYARFVDKVLKLALA